MGCAEQIRENRSLIAAFQGHRAQEGDLYKVSVYQVCEV